MPQDQPFLPTQAAEFNGSDRQAIVLYCPEWTESLLGLLASRPAAYEAAWRFAPEQRAHVLEVTYEGHSPVQIALVDGVHNSVIASLVRGRALALSPYPLYRESEGESRLFSPDESLLLPDLPKL